MLTSCSQNSEGNDTIKTLDKSESPKDSHDNFKQNSEGNDKIKTLDKSESPKDSNGNFKCSDGTTIPSVYLNDGGCDCPTTCEDENI